MFDMTGPFIWSWCVSAYSIANRPPQLWPEQAEVVLGPADRAPHLVDLVDVTGKGPQVGVVRPVALAGLELVVMIIFDAGRRQVAVHDLEIGVRQAGPARQQEQLELRIVADALDPDLMRS